MTQTTDSRTLRFLGGQLIAGDARIHGPEDGCWIVLDANSAMHRVPIHLRRSWVRYAHRGRPAGRKRAAEPSIQMGLTLPVSVHQRIPSPRQRWVREVIESRLMCDEATEYLTEGA
jgi:hypothetical protein